MFMSEAHVYDPKALDLVARAMEIAEALLPPSRRNEDTRREMALVVLTAVDDGETDVRKLAEIAAEKAA